MVNINRMERWQFVSQLYSFAVNHFCFLSASVSVLLIHPHNLLFKLSFYSAIPESPRAYCPSVNFPVCFKQEQLCLANLPPSTRDKWPFTSAAVLFLAWWEWFWLEIRDRCILCDIEQMLSANLDTRLLFHTDEKRNLWVLGFVVMGTVRPGTQRWHEENCFVLNTGFVWFFVSSLTV